MITHCFRGTWLAMGDFCRMVNIRYWCNAMGCHPTLERSAIAVALTLLLFLNFVPVSSFDLASCVRPLGMESGEIRDNQISASSSHDSSVTGPSSARLNVEKDAGAWCPKVIYEREENYKDYLEIDLERVYVIAGAETQGRFGNGVGVEYVEEYLLEYWRPGLPDWITYKNWNGLKLAGLALFGTTLWIFLDTQLYFEVAKDDNYNYVVYFLIAVSAVMTIIGFLGCCGALQESQCMLATFFSLVLVLFAGQVAAGVWSYQNSQKFVALLETSIADSIEREYGNNTLKTQAMDAIQRELQCCGSRGPQDYIKARIKEIGVGSSASVFTVPVSCCKRSVDQTTCEQSRRISHLDAVSHVINTDACTEKLIKRVNAHSWIPLTVLLVIAALEIFAMVFSLILCCAVRRIDQFKA